MHKICVNLTPLRSPGLVVFHSSHFLFSRTIQSAFPYTGKKVYSTSGANPSSFTAGTAIIPLTVEMCGVTVVALLGYSIASYVLFMKAPLKMKWHWHVQQRKMQDLSQPEFLVRTICGTDTRREGSASSGPWWRNLSPLFHRLGEPLTCPFQDSTWKRHRCTLQILDIGANTPLVLANGGKLLASSSEMIQMPYRKSYSVWVIHSPHLL